MQFAKLCALLCDDDDDLCFRIPVLQQGLMRLQAHADGLECSAPLDIICCCAGNEFCERLAFYGLVFPAIMSLT